MPNTESVLLTGGTGFLGTVIRNSLTARGCAVKTLGRSDGNDIQCDLAKATPVLVEPFDVVVHNAGKAHMVPKNPKEEQQFYDNNYQASSNLLDGLTNSGLIPKAIVFVSSIAVYGLISGQRISESHPLLATDPYGKSKIKSEQVITEWGAKHAIPVSILRLPLLAGKNPPGNLGSMIKGIRRGYYLRIEGSTARKSMVLADDVAAIIPTVASIGGVYNLTDGYHPSFAELEEIIVKQTGSKRPKNLNYTAARMLGYCGDVIDRIKPHTAPVNSKKVMKIISTLTFDDTKARNAFNWNPRRVIDEFVV